MWFLLSLVTATTIVIFVFRKRVSNQDINYKLQQVFAFCYFWLWKRNTGPMFGFDSSIKDIRKYGISPLPEATLRENPRTLGTDLNAMDSVGFSGTSNSGDVLIVRINRLHDRCSEVVVYLKLANGEEYQLPIQPGCRVYNTDGQTFSAAGLTFEVLEPLRRWRISFNGQLKATSKVESDNVVVPIKFNFIWKPMNNYSGFPHDFEARIIAKQIAKEDGIRNMLDALSHLTKDKEWNEQFGEIHGTLKIDERDETTILLRGLKDRHHGIKNWNCLNKEISIKGITETGTPFHLFETTNQIGQSVLYGYVWAPCNTIVRHVHQWSSNLNQLANDNNFAISLQTGDRNYELTMEYDNHSCEVFHGENWDFRNNIRIFKLKLNGKNGYGIMETGARWNGTNPLPIQKSLPQLTEPNIKTSDKLVVNFKDIVCQSSKFVGGKGSSLAMMTSLTNTSFRHHEFEVPQGVSVTNVAFSKHLEENQTLKRQIVTLENVAWKKTQGSLMDECERTKDLVTNTSVSKILKMQIETSLQEVFGDEYEKLKFAVRSSAIGEDGEELSAAGQNDTFLGIKGIEEICLAIVKCWASQFSHRSIEYKRQNGQLLNGGMAVVIQQMVSADVAGVLFTNDPVTGSTANMLISSNYGLGESVVSGSSDPDTIILKRSWDEKLSLMEKQIGKKNLKIVMSDKNGVVEQSISPEEASCCTITDELAIRLGKIAIYLEQCWGTARDIEWALQGDKIFLLQSRPVTTTTKMSEFEVMHEFDSVHPTDRDEYSTANVGEVFPGSKTPLTFNCVLKPAILTLSKVVSWKQQRHRYDPTVDDTMVTFFGNTFMSRVQEKFWSLTKTKTGINKAVEIGVYGRVLDDDHILEMAIDRADKPPRTAPLLLAKMMIKGLLFGKWISNSCRQKLSEFNNEGRNVVTIKEAIEQIETRFERIEDALTKHLTLSCGSMLWNLIILNLLSKNDLSNDLYADFALLTTGANDTESGDVPTSLKELASAIAKEIEPTEFRNMSPEKALNWIKENTTNSKQKLEDFFARHGHRGYKEFDLGYNPWRAQPEKLMTLMQDMLQNKACYAVAENKSKTDPISNLKTPLTSFKKTILSWLLSLARSGVQQREMAKSYLIKTTDNTRKKYRHLARLMISEGMLPEEDLIFFLTHDEIRQLIETRSAKLLQRAKQRQKLHPKMNSFKFPEISVGFPAPINEYSKDVKVDRMSEITGYPVCQGVIQGPARVIYSFDQVNTIQPGDILITHGTDIGWSPYFPLLSGVVTELGGLVSHGAVVARECGLPCIVGAVHATSVFKSGILKGFLPAQISHFHMKDEKQFYSMQLKEFSVKLQHNLPSDSQLYEVGLNLHEYQVLTWQFHF